MTWALAAEIASSILGLTSTYLLTKGDGRGWALGALMAMVSAFVFLKAQILGSFAIQFLFLVIQLTGLWKWWTGADKDLRKVCKRLTPLQMAGLALVWVSVTGGLGAVLTQYDGKLPFLDAAGTTGNVLAQLTLMSGKPECWIIYMITNVCYISLSYLGDLPVYTILYSIYMTVAYRGWRQWTSPPAENNEAPSPN